MWAAFSDIFPGIPHQRDWVHKLANVLGGLPAAVHTGARKVLAEIWHVPDRDHAERAVEAFAHDYGVNWPGRGRPLRLTETDCGRIIALARSDPSGRLVQGGEGLLAPAQPEAPAQWTLNALARPN